jgi:hypothetical protein
MLNRFVFSLEPFITQPSLRSSLTAEAISSLTEWNYLTNYSPALNRREVFV